jgi:hypothetical protein
MTKMIADPISRSSTHGIPCDSEKYGAIYHASNLMGPDPSITVAFLIEGAPFVRLPDALVAIATMR